MSDENRRGRSAGTIALIAVLVIAALYLGSYFVLMDRAVCAHDLGRVYGSSFRWAKPLGTWRGIPERHGRDSFPFAREDHWCNRVYRPLDLIFAPVRPGLWLESGAAAPPAP